MCAVYDVEGGVIRRARLYYDSATMAKQLGLMPVS
jgi:limonene-1,2-epoxide hydrolase